MSSSTWVLGEACRQVNTSEPHPFSILLRFEQQQSQDNLESNHTIITILLISYCIALDTPSCIPTSRVNVIGIVTAS